LPEVARGQIGGGELDNFNVLVLDFCPQGDISGCDNNIVAGGNIGCAWSIQPAINGKLTKAASARATNPIISRRVRFMRTPQGLKVVRAAGSG